MVSSNDETPLALARAVKQAVDRLPPDLLARSGSVFYSGREAFSGQRKLYLLGLNPGGDPLLQAGNTVGDHLRQFRERTEPWSAYADDRWEGAPPGSWGMQPRVLHMLAGIGVDPRLTPASNLVFVRSRGEADLRLEKSRLLALCWPVHEAVLSSLGVKVIVCFGSTAGSWVRERMNATKMIERFTEQNNRGWKSEFHAAPNGRFVVTATHPGRADWRNPAADPTPLVQKALDLAGRGCTLV